MVRLVPDFILCVSIEGGVVKSISPFKLKIKAVDRG